jgi:hypothetical protein
VKENTKSGQTLIETCLMLGLICIIFWSAFQLCYLFAAKEVLTYSANSVARAKTVGLNEWMVLKVGRVALISVSGRMLEPVFQNTSVQNAGLNNLSPGEAWDTALNTSPQSQQYALERARVPLYLSSVNNVRSSGVLDYQNWDNIRVDANGGVVGGLLDVTIEQEYPELFPIMWSFVSANATSIWLRSNVELESHYPLYLDDMGY